MLFDDKMALWIKGGGEVDLPRNPEANWGVDNEVAYRTIRWNTESNKWEYFTRIGYTGDVQPLHLVYDNLAAMVRETNKIHGVEDEVSTEF